MVEIVIIQALTEYIDIQDDRTKKLFYKQKKFMEMYPDYPSLGRKKLVNVSDRFGNSLFEIRLDIHRRIICLEKEGRVFWLKITNHDDISRNNKMNIDGWSGLGDEL